MRPINLYNPYFLVFLCLTLLGVVPRTEAQAPLNITTTAVPFLRIAPDARAGGMGDLGLATTPDANAVFSNRAKLPFDSAVGGLSANYTPWLSKVTDGIYLASIGGFYKPDEGSALSLGIRYFNIGDLPIEDNSGHTLLTAHPKEFALDLGYSRKLSSEWGIGVALRYINSNLATGNENGINYRAATSVAGDVSLYYRQQKADRRGWSAGLVVSNLGSKVSYTDDPADKDYLPSMIGVGIQYTFVFDEDSRLSVGTDVNKLLVPALPDDSSGLYSYYHMGLIQSWGKSFNNSAYAVSVGGEYNYADLLFLRLGYARQTQNMGDQRYWTAGLGLQWKKTSINFSYLIPSGDGVLQSPLSNTVRFGVLLRF